MKKSRKVMLALLALCAAAAMGACNYVAQGPDSGLSDSVSSSQGQSSSEQASSSDGGSDSAEQSSSAGQSDAPGEDSSDSGSDSSDSGSDSSGDSGEEPSVPAVDVGVFARRWVNADTTIDLATGTMTGTENFAVTSFTDAGADSVIACTADGTDYILAPDADGALAMYAAADYSSSTDEEGNGPVPLKNSDGGRGALRRRVADGRPVHVHVLCNYSVYRRGRIFFVGYVFRPVARIGGNGRHGAHVAHFCRGRLGAAFLYRRFLRLHVYDDRVGRERARMRRRLVGVRAVSAAGGLRQLLSLGERGQNFAGFRGGDGVVQRHGGFLRGGSRGIRQRPDV